MELSHFNIGGVNYRFDVYRQANPISWKPNCDDLPQFGVHYEKSYLEPLKENKPFKKGEQQIKLDYYPGMTLYIKLPRNPIQPSLQFFVPNVILSVFIACANQIEGELADMLGTVSLSLLTLVALYQQIRDNLPPTLKITYIEKIVMIYIFYSLVPVIDIAFCNAQLKGTPSFVLWCILNFFIVGSFLIYFIRQYHDSLDRDPPKQKKVDGGKKAPDESWSNPTLNE